MRIHGVASVALFALGACVDTDTSSNTAALESGTWKVTPTASVLPVGTYGNKLNAVAAISPTDVWSVGYSPLPGGPVYAKVAMAEHFDGRSWSILPTVTLNNTNEELRSLKAFASNDVWTVGYSSAACLCNQSLAGHWDGHTWSLIASPNFGVSTDFRAVDGISTRNLWVVGSYWVGTTEFSLVLRWNGHSWKSIPGPFPANSYLSAVSVVDANNVFVIGVGAFNTPLLYKWSSGTWTQIAFPVEQISVIDTVPRGITAVTATDVWLDGWLDVPAGTEGQTTVARTWHYDGSALSGVANPIMDYGIASSLEGIAAVASNDIWAVGDNTGNVKTLHWDGVQWAEVANPGGGYLFGVSADSSTDVWAVGFQAGLTTFGMHDSVP